MCLVLALILHSNTANLSLNLCLCYDKVDVTNDRSLMKTVPEITNIST